LLLTAGELMRTAAGKAVQLHQRQFFRHDGLDVGRL
jgi:hypothetical protein